MTIYTESPRLERMLETIPPFYRNDPVVRGLLNAEAKELDRLEEALLAVQLIPFPRRSEKFLSLWEQFFDIPIEPEESITVRQNLVLREFQRIAQVTYGIVWEERLGAAIGGVWTYEEDEGIINIILPYSEGAGKTRFITNYARAITPAAWEIHVFFAEGFILGVSELGVSEFR